jgi:hypothetical protein
VNVVSSGLPDWAVALTGVTTALLAVGALLALRAIKVARQASHAESLTGAAIRWNQPEFQKARAAFGNHLKAGGPEELRNQMRALSQIDLVKYYELRTVMDYFEDIGILYKYRAIKLDMIDDALGATICDYWDDSKPYVLEVLRVKDGTYYRGFETLATEIANKRAEPPLTHRVLIKWKQACEKARGRSPTAKTKAEHRKLILLSAATPRARAAASDICRDLTSPGLVMVSQSVSEPVLDDGSAMVVFRASDGSIVSVLMWGDELRGCTTSRVFALGR